MFLISTRVREIEVELTLLLYIYILYIYMYIHLFVNFLSTKEVTNSFSETTWSCVLRLMCT